MNITMDYTATLWDSMSALERLRVLQSVPQMNERTCHGYAYQTAVAGWAELRPLQREAVFHLLTTGRSA